MTLKKLAKFFYKYYTELYNLPQPHKPADLIGTHPQLLKQFLIDSGLPTLEDHDAQQFEIPITEDELLQTIKSMNIITKPSHHF